MQVRLVEEKFGSDLYELELTEEGLVFSKPEGLRTAIPFSQLKHFSLEGKGTELRRFVLETDAGLREGNFLRQEDSDRVIGLLRERCSCYVDMRLDMA